MGVLKLFLVIFVFNNHFNRADSKSVDLANDAEGQALMQTFIGILEQNNKLAARSGDVIQFTDAEIQNVISILIKKHPEAAPFITADVVKKKVAGVSPEAKYLIKFIFDGLRGIPRKVDAQKLKPVIMKVLSESSELAVAIKHEFEKGSSHAQHSHSRVHPHLHAHPVNRQLPNSPPRDVKISEDKVRQVLVQFKNTPEFAKLQVKDEDAVKIIAAKLNSLRPIGRTLTSAIIDKFLEKGHGGAQTPVQTQNIGQGFAMRGLPSQSSPAVTADSPSGSTAVTAGSPSGSTAVAAGSPSGSTAVAAGSPSGSTAVAADSPSGSAAVAADSPSNSPPAVANQAVSSPAVGSAPEGKDEDHFFRQLLKEIGNILRQDKSLQELAKLATKNAGQYVLKEAIQALETSIASKALAVRSRMADPNMTDYLFNELANAIVFQIKQKHLIFKDIAEHSPAYIQLVDLFLLCIMEDKSSDCQAQREKIASVLGKLKKPQNLKLSHNIETSLQKILQKSLTPVTFT